jgi:hypothetical protein
MISPTPKKFPPLNLKNPFSSSTLKIQAMERLRKCAWRKEQMAKRGKSVQQFEAVDNPEDVGSPSRKGGCTVLGGGPHQIERDVQRALLSQPGLRFSSLVVRRVGRGVFCLEGVLETAGKTPDVSGLARRVAGVDRVLNRLVVRQPHESALSLQSN